MFNQDQVRIGVDYKIHFAVRALLFAMSKHRRRVTPGQFPTGGVQIISVMDAWRGLFWHPPEWQAIVDAKPYRASVLRRILALYVQHADREVLYCTNGHGITDLLGYFTVEEQEKIINILEAQCKLRFGVTNHVGHTGS